MLTCSFLFCLLMGLLPTNIRKMFYKNNSCYFSGLSMPSEQINYLRYYSVICCDLFGGAFSGVLAVLCRLSSLERYILGPGI